MLRDLDKLKQWSCVNAEVQHGQVQAPVSIKAGEMKGLRGHFRKGCGVLVHEKLVIC